MKLEKCKESHFSMKQHYKKYIERQLEYITSWSFRTELDSTNVQFEPWKIYEAFRSHQSESLIFRVTLREVFVIYRRPSVSF